MDNKVQNKCKSKEKIIWKSGIEERIFNLQLHDFLETKMKCVGGRRNLSKGGNNSGKHQEWEYTGVSRYRNKTDAFVFLTFPDFE